MPPFTIAVMFPFCKPQVASLELKLILISAGEVIVIVLVNEQPLLSVMITEYPPAPKLFIEEVVAPVDHEYVLLPLPPEEIIDADPLVSPALPRNLAQNRWRLPAPALS